MVFQNDRFPPLPQRWPASIVGGQLINEPPASFVGRFPREFASATITVSIPALTAYASATVTVSGAIIDSGDTLAVTITQASLPGGAITKTVVAAGGDTTESLAQKLAAAICNDANLQAAGCYATSLLGVVTVYFPGAGGNSAVLTQLASIGSETLTLSNGGDLSGGAGLGPIDSGDTLEISVNLPALPGGSITKTVTATGSDTTTTLAQKLAKAINDDPVLQSYGAYADTLANVVTFYWPGPLGNFVTLTQSVTTGTETITLGNSGALAGGSGPVIPYNTFRFQVDGQLFEFQANMPKIVGGNVVAALATAGSAIT